MTTEESHKGDGGRRDWVLSTTFSTFFKDILSAPRLQMVNLPPVGGLITTRDEPIRGGVVRSFRILTD